MICSWRKDPQCEVQPSLQGWLIFLCSGYDESGLISGCGCLGWVAACNIIISQGGATTMIYLFGDLADLEDLLGRVMEPE